MGLGLGFGKRTGLGLGLAKIVRVRVRVRKKGYHHEVLGEDVEYYVPIEVVIDRILPNGLIQVLTAYYLRG